MGRPKGSRNKPKPGVLKYPKSMDDLQVSHVKAIKYKAPWDLEKYELKRLYWYLLAIEKKIMVDPTSVSPARYKEALLAYTNAVREYENAKKGMDKKRPDSRSTKRSGSSGTGQDGSADMVSGVPAVNPIA